MVIKFGDNDNDYNDEYYEGSSVKIAFYRNGQLFMDYDMQSDEWTQENVVNPEDEVDDERPTIDSASYFTALGKLPFVWTGENYQIKLEDYL